MKRLLATVVAFFALAAPAHATTIWISNESTTVSDAELARELPVLQAQVHNDFAPIWGMDAEVRVGTPPDGAWVMHILDEATIYGALGYHDVCNQDGHGVPCGYVFAQTTLDAGDSVSVTLDHELLEMIADPYTTTMQKVGPRFYIQEVCDAPEDDRYAYTQGGVQLSDFVTPYWFRPGHVGPYDFRGLIKRPLQLLPGGYISWWQNGSWHQKFEGFGSAWMASSAEKPKAK